MESPLMISAFSIFASPMLSFVFPTAVGPTSMTTGCFLFFNMYHSLL
ncbi:Hypothetical protein ACI5QL_01885 [Bacillus velezensis]